MPRWDLLASPVFVASVVVLLLNDHVLKAAWPGLITGKLSDIAGVVMVAIALTAVLGGRRHAAFVTTGVAFTLLKTVPAVANAAVPLLGGRTRTDPTDVLALLALVPLWQWLARPAPAPTDRRGWVVAMQVVAVSTAVFATTSSGCSPDGVSEFRATANGSLITDSFPTYLSSDGGVTWGIVPPTGPLSPGGRCFADGVCVEIVTEETTRGLVATDNSISQSFHWTEIDDLGRFDRPSCFAGAFSDVAVVDVDGTEHLVVAMGWLGALHAERGEPLEWVAVGEWGVQEQDAAERPLGFDVASTTPNEGLGFRLPRPVSLGLIAVAALGPLAAYIRMAVDARRRGPRLRTADRLVGVVGLVALVWAVPLVVSSVVFERTDSDLTAQALALFGAVALALCLIAGFRWIQRRRPLPPPDAATRAD